MSILQNEIEIAAPVDFIDENGGGPGVPLRHLRLEGRCGSGAVVLSWSLLIRRAQRARCQAETPLIVLCRFPEPALSPHNGEKTNHPPDDPGIHPQNAICLVRPSSCAKMDLHPVHGTFKNNIPLYQLDFDLRVI
jgi:hypothetical protein